MYYREWVDDTQENKDYNVAKLKKNIEAAIKVMSDQYGNYVYADKDKLLSFLQSNFPYVDHKYNDRKKKGSKVVSFILCKGQYHHLVIEVDNKNRSMFVRLKKFDASLKN